MEQDGRTVLNNADYGSASINLLFVSYTYVLTHYFRINYNICRFKLSVSCTKIRIIDHPSFSDINN